MTPPADAPALAAAAAEALAEARRRLAAFPGLPADADAQAVAEAFDRITHPLNGVEGWIGLFAHVHPDGAVREAARRAEQELEAFGTELGLDRAAWRRLAAAGEQLDGADPAVRRLLEHALRDYRRSGVDRDEPTRERIRALRDELVRQGQGFDENLATLGRSFRVDGGHADLAGLPSDFLAARPEDQCGGLTLGTDPADRVPILTYAENDTLRAGYFVAAMQRAVPENLAILPELLAKRHELATLLGFASWADYVTEDKMTGSAAAAREFVERVIDVARPRAEAELAELLAAKRARLGPDAEPWIRESERLFYVERVKAERYGLDSREVRPYLAFENVLRGVLTTTEALYGVSVRRDEGAELWHGSVRAYDVLEDGRPVARFYLDLFPREGKFKHAAMFSVASGLQDGPLPEACLVCNFTEPKGADPALMLHDEVTTFFHEFGHLLHHLFAGRQRFLRFSGIACEWDFVEAPSQLYEEWAWDTRVLASFARHVESGEPIPAELVERMRAAEEYGKALHAIQQMFYARLSLSYYERDPRGLDLTREMIELKQRVLPFPHEDGTYMHAGFGHLHGYSAMYYTYMWSLAIAKDLRSRFESDLLHTGVAREYRDQILAPGGSRDARELVRAFLGRDSDLVALERWLGR